MTNLLPGKPNTESGKDYENMFFEEITKLTSGEVGVLEERLENLKESIKVFKEQYDEGDYEVAPLIDNASNEARHTVDEIRTAKKRGSKPYFGREEPVSGGIRQRSWLLTGELRYQMPITKTDWGK